MSGCHPINACYHVDGEFCDRCYTPKEDEPQLLKDLRLMASKIDELKNKVEALENMSEYKKIEACLFEGAQTHASILRCEAALKGMSDHDERISGFEEMGIETRLLKLEESINSYIEANNEDNEYADGRVKEEIEKLNIRCNQIYGLTDLIQIRITQEVRKLTDIKKVKQPHKCPICEGTTFCDEGMMCVPCDGTGIVWG